jgi:CBS domain-containing protein
MTVAPDASVRDALNIMREHRVGAVLVVDGDSLRGIFSERDLLSRVLREGRSLDLAVETVMSPNPVCGRENEPVASALARMQAGGHRHLPLRDERGRPVGTLSIRRVAQVLGDHFGPAACGMPLGPMIDMGDRDDG